MRYFVYILKSCKDSSFYIGHTADLEDRLLRHNQRREKSTKSKVPWMLVHHEAFEDRSRAVRREKQIKSYKGGEALKRLLQYVKPGSSSDG